ncbi:transposase [Celeribacter sp.]|uniref:transposase n=1 Tax=Celeribacter sp. TaxID=1890673 RepID=UPI003A8D13E7
MTENGFANTTLERIHWLTLYLRLPAGGVDEKFPTESACEERLREIRWPEGLTCPKCSKKDIGNLTSENFYPCKSCKKQFSDTSGTILHGRMLDLRVYFQFSADIVLHQKIGTIPSAHVTKDSLGLAYATAYRLKKNLTRSLTEVDGGLLGRCICVDEIDLPQHIDPGSEVHLIWLDAEDRRRRQRSLGFE